MAASPPGRADLDVGGCDPTERHVGVRLTGAADGLDLDDVEIEEALVEDVHLDGGRVGRLVLVDVECRRCSATATAFPDGRLDRVQLADARLAGVSVDGSVWQDVTVTDVRAVRTSARTVTWRRVVLTGCDLTGLDATSARWDRVRFERCGLAEADLAGLRTTGVTFTECDLSAVRNVGALRGATVDASTLATASGAMAAELGLRVARPGGGQSR